MALALAGPITFVFWFFRDPPRTIPEGERLVVSPADGLVTAVEGLTQGEFGTRISIRLSLLDVHVTRAPIAGTVAAIDYRPARFRNAYRESSARDNEQNRVRIEGQQHPVLLIQIAGKIARRIVFRPRLGDRAERGQRVGMIRFGSRVDLHLPPGAEVLVSVGDRVRGGSTVVARGVS